MKTKLLLSALLMLCLSTFVRAQGNLPPWLIELAPDKGHVLFSGPGGVYDHAKLDSLVGLYQRRAAFYHFVHSDSSYTLPIDTLVKYDILTISVQTSHTRPNNVITFPDIPDSIYNGKVIILNMDSGDEVLDTVLVRVAGDSRLIQDDCYQAGRSEQDDIFIINYYSPQTVIYHTAYRDDYYRQCEGLITLSDGSAVLPNDTLPYKVLNDTLTLTVCNYGCDFETLYQAFKEASKYTLNLDTSLLNLPSYPLRQVVVKIQNNSDNTPTRFDEYFWLFGGDWSNVGLTSDGNTHYYDHNDFFMFFENCVPPMFHNLDIDGSSSTGSSAMVFTACSNIFMNDVDITGFARNLWLLNSSNARLVNCDFNGGTVNNVIIQEGMASFQGGSLTGATGGASNLNTSGSNVNLRSTTIGTATSQSIVSVNGNLSFISCTLPTINTTNYRLEHTTARFDATNPAISPPFKWNQISSLSNLLLNADQPLPITTPVVSSYTPITSSFTATLDEVHIVSVSGGNVTVTPPASAQQGDIFGVRLSSFNPANTCTIDFVAGGYNYLGESTLPNASHVLNSSGAGAIFQFIGGSTGWTIKSAH